MVKKSKKVIKTPKPRGVWDINPKTRVTPNKKKDVGTRHEKNSKKRMSDLDG